MTFSAPALTSSFVETNGVKLHVMSAGAGPLVVFLHGFPEFWFAWRNIAPRLAEAGFRVVAVDLRGYNLSDKPEGVKSYTTDVLVADIAGLVKSLKKEGERCFIVGHDWGAGIAWAFAMEHPDLFDRLAVLNGPHPQRLLEALKKNPLQLLKSWYAFFFQLPWLPEQIAQMDRFDLLVKPLREEPRRPIHFEDLERYRLAFARPGALQAMLSYYRGMFRTRQQEIKAIEAPVLVIWGDDDPHIGRELAMPDLDLVPHVRVEYVAGATHWVHHDEPELVTRLLASFFREQHD